MLVEIDEKPKTKKQIKREMAEDMLDTVKVTESYQRKPWTFVKYTVLNNANETVELFGFSKVCYPDKWDENYGLWLAIEKSIYAHVRTLLIEEEIRTGVRVYK